MQTYNKVYKDELEELQRHLVWQSSKRYVEAHNSNAKELGFTLALNHFSDLSAAETKMYTGNIIEDLPRDAKFFKPHPSVDVSDVLAWRRKCVDED